MPTTPNRYYPYPSLSDPPNGAAQIQALAEAVDTDVQLLNDEVVALNVYDEIDLTLVSPFSGTITLRRYGNMVHCMYSVSRSTGNAKTTVATIPIGWRPTYDIITFTVTATTVRSEFEFLQTGVITENSSTASAATRRPGAPIIWVLP